MAENVKSFFQKEEELEQQPEKAPDAAMELYEKPIDKAHAIVPHHLPKKKTPATPAVKPKLPFSSAEMREKLANASLENTPSAPSTAQPASSAPAISEEEMSSQIAEFEQAMTEIPGHEQDTAEESAVASASVPATQKDTPGHFDAVAKELKKKGYDQGALVDAVARMKEHHAQRAAAVQHQAKAAKLEQGLSQKLAELQGLEQEWARKHDEIAAAQHRMQELESSIASKTDELKGVVGTMRDHVQQIPVPQAAPSPEPSPSRPDPDSFVLANGMAIHTLAALREALLSMDDGLFHTHVTPERNDFATWIEMVFKDEALASRAVHARNKFDLARVLEAAGH